MNAAILSLFAILMSVAPGTIKSKLDLPQSAIDLFEPARYEQVGISTSEVCSGDFSISGYSCVSGDLKGLGYDTKSIYENDYIITLTDDQELGDVFIYAYLKESAYYNRVSLSFDGEDFFKLKSKEEIETSFVDFNIEAVSLSSNGHYVKYLVKLNNEDLPVDWFKKPERNYVIRELYSSESNSILPSAINYAVITKEDGSIETIQTNLNPYSAEQYLCESYIHIADKIEGIPLNYDSRIMGQYLLLFNLKKDQEEFTRKLRAVEVKADQYQWFGALNLPVRDNAERGEKVVSQMIANKWISGTSGTLAENFHKKDVIKCKSNVIEPSVKTINYKPSFWHFWRTRSYTWNDLDFTANFDKANKYVATDLLSKYTYYAVLKTFNFEISPSAYKAVDNKTYWQISDRNDEYLPFCFENVSLAQFWWEEDSEVKRGIVISEYNKSNGAVKFTSNTTVIPNAVKWTIGIIVALLLLLLLPILIPVFKLVYTGIKYIFLFVTWPIRFVVRKVRGD